MSDYMTKPDLRMQIECVLVDIVLGILCGLGFNFL